MRLPDQVLSEADFEQLPPTLQRKVGTTSVFYSTVLCLQICALASLANLIIEFLETVDRFCQEHVLCGKHRYCRHRCRQGAWLTSDPIEETGLMDEVL